MINIFEQNNLSKLAEEFLEISYNARKWEKWILPNSKTNEREKAIISGHYVFANPHVIEIKNKASKHLESKNINLDFYLKKQIEKCMMRFIRNFRLNRRF